MVPFLWLQLLISQMLLRNVHCCAAFFKIFQQDFAVWKNRDIFTSDCKTPVQSRPIQKVAVCLKSLFFGPNTPAPNCAGTACLGKPPASHSIKLNFGRANTVKSWHTEVSGKADLSYQATRSLVKDWSWNMHVSVTQTCCVVNLAKNLKHFEIKP